MTDRTPSVIPNSLLLPRVITSLMQVNLTKVKNNGVSDARKETCTDPRKKNALRCKHRYTNIEKKPYCMRNELDNIPNNGDQHPTKTKRKKSKEIV